MVCSTRFKWPWLQAPHRSKRQFILIEVRPKWRVEKIRTPARKGRWYNKKMLEINWISLAKVGQIKWSFSKHCKFSYSPNTRNILF